MDTPRKAYSIVEFCRAHGISRATLYNLWRDGNGPRVMHVAGRRLISEEAAADWRKERESEVEAA